MEFKAAIIDLDGVVLDSLGVWQDIDREYLAVHGLGGRPEINERLNRSSTLMDAAEYLHNECGVTKSPEAICAEFNELLADHYRHTLVLIEGAKEVLDRLYAMRIKMALVTASPEDLVHAALKRNKADHYFSHFFCTADKLIPKTFHNAVSALGSRPDETIVVDDLDRIRAVAESLGFRTYRALDEVFGL